MNRTMQLANHIAGLPCHHPCIVEQAGVNELTVSFLRGTDVHKLRGRELPFSVQINGLWAFGYCRCWHVKESSAGYRFRGEVIKSLWCKEMLNEWPASRFN